MSSPSPIPLSYAILALIGEGGASAHDLVEYSRRGGPPFWTSAPSQIYAEPKRLERLGWVSATIEPGRTRERRVYRLTDTGRQALCDWAREPAPFADIRDQAHVRLLAGDMLDDDDIVRSLTAMRPRLNEIEALLAESERRASTLPHRERHLLLAQSLGRHLLNAYRDWIDEVERELEKPTGERRPLTGLTRRPRGSVSPFAELHGAAGRAGAKRSVFIGRRRGRIPARIPVSARSPFRLSSVAGVGGLGAGFRR